MRSPLNAISLVVLWFQKRRQGQVHRTARHVRAAVRALIAAKGLLEAAQEAADVQDRR